MLRSRVLQAKQTDGVMDLMRVTLGLVMAVSVLLLASAALHLVKAAVSEDGNGNERQHGVFAAMADTGAQFQS